MSAPVDVLAVLDRYASRYTRHDGADLRAARADIAELIEAASDLIVASNLCINPGDMDDLDAMMMFVDAEKRIRAAFSRVRGDAA